MAITIICPGGAGDILLATGILKYRDELWPGEKIVWFSAENNLYVLDGIRCIDQVKKVVIDTCYRWEDLAPNKVFVPCAWMNWPGQPEPFPPEMTTIEKIRYSFEKRMPGTKIVGEWHPCLEYSEQDEAEALDIVRRLPAGKKIMLETEFRSGQSFLDESTLSEMMEKVRSVWGDCSFVFVSKKNAACEDKGVFQFPGLSFPVVLALFGCMDAFMGVASGITCAICSWAANPDVPRFEVINHPSMVTREIARGPYSVALEKGGLFGKLSSFLGGNYDFIPSNRTSPLS